MVMPSKEGGRIFEVPVTALLGNSVPEGKDASEIEEVVKQLAILNEQMAKDAGIPEDKFQVTWHATNDERTTGKMTFEEVIERIPLEKCLCTTRDGRKTVKIMKICLIWEVIIVSIKIGKIVWRL